MIEPPPVSFIAWAASTTQCMVPSTLTDMWRRQWSSVMSSSPSGSAMPAWAHITSMRRIRPCTARPLGGSCADGHIAGEGDAARAESGHGLRQLVTVQVECDYPGALVKEPLHDPEPDALRGAGDDDCLAFDAPR